MRQEEKITGACFQMTKRNVNFNFKFLDIYSHKLIFKPSIKCVRNYNCFRCISRQFFVWHEHFAGDYFCGLGQLVLFRQKIKSVSK